MHKGSNEGGGAGQGRAGEDSNQVARGQVLRPLKETSGSESQSRGEVACPFFCLGVDERRGAGTIAKGKQS